MKVPKSCAAKKLTRTNGMKVPKSCAAKKLTRTNGMKVPKSCATKKLNTRKMEWKFANHMQQRNLPE